MRNPTILILFPMLLTGACSSGNGSSGSAKNQNSNLVEIPFRATDFPGGAIDNLFFPLTPGTEYTYEKETDEGLEVLIVEVTTDVRVILGVPCVVVHATESLDGELIEDTFDWYSQDRDGNVWYLGEDSTAFADGQESTAGSWEAGVDGAEPGIIMFAQPMVGESYRQEHAPNSDALDMGTVISLDETVTVEFGTFAGCRQIADSTPLEPGVIEDKFYAPGVGLVLEIDEEGVRTELIGVQQQ